ncbi:hypothetical protein QYE76_036570 [Lolium multiflorum]|uniref:Uncharacterized protein n=1 Tax=Lolium multiflorum TaxID=4521 RepID=A0AAD8R317_LOLMU|nr:hypothetical protein QYE76_036570 [Lolium multiflorum]
MAAGDGNGAALPLGESLGLVLTESTMAHDLLDHAQRDALQRIHQALMAVQRMSHHEVDLLTQRPGKGEGRGKGRGKLTVAAVWSSSNGGDRVFLLQRRRQRGPPPTATAAWSSSDVPYSNGGGGVMGQGVGAGGGGWWRTVEDGVAGQ